MLHKRQGRFLTKISLSYLLQIILAMALLALLLIFPPSLWAQDKLETIGPNNIAQLETLAVLGQGSLTDVAWSSDGKLIAASSSLGVWVYDAQRFSQKPLLLQGQPSAYFMKVAFSPDGSLLAASDTLSTTHVWKINVLHTGMPEEGTLTAPNSWSSGSVAFSPDGTLLAHDNQHSEGSRIYFWNTKTKQELPFFQGTDARDIAFSPDGKLLAEADFGGYAQLWAVQTGKQLAELPAAGTGVFKVAFSPDSKLLATEGDSMVRLWNIEDVLRQAKVNPRIPDPRGAVFYGNEALAFSPNGKFILSGNTNGGINVWPIVDALKHTDLELDSSKPPYPTHIGDRQAHTTALAFNPDGSRLVTIDNLNTVRIWALGSGAELAQQSQGHSGSVLSVAFNPDTTLLASGGTDRSIRLWDVATYKQLTVFKSTSSIRSLAFSPDGKLLAAAGDDLEIWNVSAQKLWWRSKRTKHAEVASLSFSPDGQTLFVADGTLTVWSTHTGKQLALIQGKSCFSLTSWHTTLACESQQRGAIQLWDISSSLLLTKGTLYSPNNPSITFRSHSALAFIDGGTLLEVLASQQGHDPAHWLVRKWNVRDLNLMSDIKADDTQAQWDGSWMVFNPDGTLFVTNAAVPNFAVMYVHSMQTGKLLHILLGHTNPINGMAFSTDGRLLVSASDDNTVRLWGVRQP
ncbi:MAG: WD40 repeat domain-containing protein [Chloroflexota bacterium]